MSQEFSGDEDMLEEYNFSKGVRGKYVRRFEKGCNVVLEPDVAEIFTDAESVNHALRNIAHIIRNQMQGHETRRCLCEDDLRRMELGVSL